MHSKGGPQVLSIINNCGEHGRCVHRSPGAQGAVNGQRAAACGGSGGAGAAGEERPSLEPADDRGVAARGGEGALLGRSPQRGAFVPANHLLNFQYDTRAAVGRTIHVDFLYIWSNTHRIRLRTCILQQQVSGTHHTGGNCL